MRRVRELLLGLGIAAIAAVQASAATGVSIDVARIAVSETLVPGEEYQLPTFGVRNPGTEPTTYRLTVTYVDGQDALPPPADWFEFEPGEVTVAPSASVPIETRLRVPPDAEPGGYEALVGPQIAVEGSGAQVGAAAAARLSFMVAPSSGLDAWLRAIGRFLAENPWLLLVPALIALAGITWYLRRRYSITITRRA